MTSNLASKIQKMEQAARQSGDKKLLKKALIAKALLAMAKQKRGEEK